jgi:hypothetical protein
MTIVLVIRVPNDECATAKVLLRNAKALIVAILIGVDSHVGIIIELIDVLLKIEGQRYFISNVFEKNGRTFVAHYSRVVAYAELPKPPTVMDIVFSDGMVLGVTSVLSSIH